MIFLSPLLLSLSTNIATLAVSLSYGIKKIHLCKSYIILLSIITSFSTFISMYIGKLILPLIDFHVSNLFGAILLSYIGISFIVEYIRLEKKHAGYDTSYYYESSLNYKNILENPYIIDSDNSYSLDIKECLTLSIALSLDNICTNFAASITGVSIGFGVFFNFILSIFSVYLGCFNHSNCISKWFIKYSNLISGILLIIFGIYEIFI